jgi:hypothetical protein
MAKAFLETTKWDGDIQNHIYLLEGDKAIAYIGERTTVAHYFKKPITIDKRGRTFIEVATTLFEEEVNTDLREVAGSKGAVYYVNDEEKTCTCPGFTFRGTCKHLVK